jgi:hypothetical protein
MATADRRRGSQFLNCRRQCIAESIERLQWLANDVIPLVPG